MRATTLPTAARTAAVVLGVLAAIAAVNTALIVGHAVREGAGAGLVVASAASIAVTMAIAYSARRVWQRGRPDSE